MIAKIGIIGLGNRGMSVLVNIIEFIVVTTHAI